MSNAYEIDFATATMADLENLTLDEVLGENLGSVELSSALPDMVGIFVIHKIELLKKEADPDNNKKANLTVAIQCKVVKPLQCADSTVDMDDLTGKMHYQRFLISQEFGQQQLEKFLMGILGVAFKDKAAIAEIGQSKSALLEEIKTAALPFGATVKNKESGGYENSDFVFTEKAFIASDDAVDLLD